MTPKWTPRRFRCQLQKNAICRVLSQCDQLNPLVLVVVGLWTEDTVLEPETVQRKTGCNKLSKR